ncbi:hypothetical protein PTI98_006264 [Pleurotus ostreatus]|nr:hypothetical protein PTI98_006264 [Pleurotus ostreatus]
MEIATPVIAGMVLGIVCLNLVVAAAWFWVRRGAGDTIWGPSITSDSFNRVDERRSKPNPLDFSSTIYTTSQYAPDSRQYRIEAFVRLYPRFLFPPTI